MISRRTFLLGSMSISTAALLASCGSSASSTGSNSAPIQYGVSGPFTGNAAEYGTTWKKAFGLALDEINSAGGILGRKIQLVYEDTQADPKQSVVVAQKFVNNPAILAELGDLSSSASMAASPIYQRAKLVQFGFQNANPNFTTYGDFMFSTTPTETQQTQYLAEVAVQRAGKRQVVLYQESAWGQSTQNAYIAKAKELGADILLAESYLTSETDYRPLLLKARDAQPDAVVLLSYYNDGALLTQQAKNVGLTAQLVADDGCYSPQYITLGGSATNGVILTTPFFPTDSRPPVQKFVQAYHQRYQEDPDLFAIMAYDALKILAWATQKGGASRTGIQQALLHGTAIPSVLYGPFQFDGERRVNNAPQVAIAVQKGQFTLLK